MPLRKAPGCLVIPIASAIVPDPPSPAKALSTYRTSSEEIEATAFQKWLSGSTPSEIARELRVGTRFIDNCIRSNVTPIRRRAA